MIMLVLMKMLLVVMLLVIVVRLWLVLMSVATVGRDVGRGLVGMGRALSSGCGPVGGSGQTRCRGEGSYARPNIAGVPWKCYGDADVGNILRPFRPTHPPSWSTQWFNFITNIYI